MKRYNLKPFEKEFSWGKMNVIELGENGRGRHLEYVPFHAPVESRYVEIGQSRSDKPKIIESKSSEGWLARISSSGSYTRGTYGSVYCLQGAPIIVIAKGLGAYGDAGRIGCWWDFLISLPENTFIKVRPSGGEYKVEHHWLFFGAQEVLRVEKHEIEIFCEANGLPQPPEKFDDLEDIASLHWRK